MSIKSEDGSQLLAEYEIPKTKLADALAPILMARKLTKNLAATRIQEKFRVRRAKATAELAAAADEAADEGCGTCEQERVRVRVDCGKRFPIDAYGRFCFKPQTKHGEFAVAAPFLVITCGLASCLSSSLSCCLFSARNGEERTLTDAPPPITRHTCTSQKRKLVSQPCTLQTHRGTDPTAVTAGDSVLHQFDWDFTADLEVDQGRPVIELGIEVFNGFGSQEVRHCLCLVFPLRSCLRHCLCPVCSATVAANSLPLPCVLSGRREDRIGNRAVQARRGGLGEVRLEPGEPAVNRPHKLTMQLTTMFCAPARKISWRTGISLHCAASGRSTHGLPCASPARNKPRAR